jgi:hypothetical protein
LSKDGGYTWTLLNRKKQKDLSGPVSENIWVSRITASAFRESRVYLALNGYRNDDFSAYLFSSEDFGTTWKRIGTDLPFEPINVIREDPKNDQIIYAGTDGGLYVSFDRGHTFMAWNAGLPLSVPIHDIAIQIRENEIILGSHGRSIYIAKLDDVQELQKDRDWLNKKPKAKQQTDNNERKSGAPDAKE